MKPARWSLGVLNDRETEQVPGKSQFLLMKKKRSLQKSASLFFADLISLFNHVFQVQYS